MSESARFSLDGSTGGEFYVLTGETTTVYEAYTDAVADVRTALEEDADCLLAAVTVQADSGEDVTVSLEQVGWRRILRDLDGETISDTGGEDDRAD